MKLIVAAVALVTLAACAKPAPIAGSPLPPSVEREFDARAAQVATAWTAPGVIEAWRQKFIPLGDLTQLDGDPHFTGAQKVAYGNGWITFQGARPLPPPGSGRVTYADGTSTDLPLQTEQDAFAQIGTRTGACDADCTPLIATRADLGSMTLRTSRGDARVPAWIFTIENLTAKVARIAVAPSAISPPPTIEIGDPQGTGWMGASALKSATGTTVTFEIFYGSCDSGFTPLAYEDENTIVLGTTITHGTGACDLAGHITSLEITLTRPVGDRLILDAQTGQALVPAA